jgi:Uma2 family endonuclease
MAVQILRWQFTVADFARMVEAGILAEDDRVELIDGEVRAMSPIGPRHVAIVNRLNALMSRQLADNAIVSVQNPIQLTDYTEPQPDIAVLRPREDFYARALPLPEDVLLVVEVAETSLEYDREEKLPRYAQVGIPEVWLIDVERETVTQYTQPDGMHYRHEQSLARGQRLVSVSVSTLRLSVDDIFG